ncbi:MAG: NAD(P)-binding domain-containing protein [Bacteriovorax sp.]|nr:NAD(P)-binding domain-containing protein [Bacteriovorax sp.]
MENSINQKVVIIGAGPAGLILGYYLSRHNVDYLILEQNDKVGSSWTQMPDHLHLISYWKSNFLLEEDLKLFDSNKTLTAKDYALYLENFSNSHHLKVKTRNNVLEITKENSHFVVRTHSDKYKAALVVDCRGYFSFPYIPLLKINGNAPFMMHFKDYKNCSQLNQHNKILVIGKRLSAGQLLCELATTGKHQLFLSVRSPVRFSPPLFLLKHFLKHLNFYEGIIKKFNIRIKEAREVPMHINAKMVIKNHVKVLGDIVKIENKKVHFTCGTIQEIDAIIFATGFRPTAIHLRNDFESSTVDGLYYLGRGTQRTFTSRFIRGIREDASVLGQLILGRLPPNNKSQ